MPTADSRGLMAARATCSKPINIAVMSASISRAEDPKTSLICTRASARASFAGPRIVVVPIPWRTRKRRTQILLLGANLQLYLDDRLELLPANERVTDGTRTRALRSHNPYEHVRGRPVASPYVAYVCRKPDISRIESPYVSGCVPASIAATLLPFLPWAKP